MTISSRTPEGEPQRCSVCGHEAPIELSAVSADALCPQCGSLLWLKQRRLPRRSLGKRLRVARAITKVTISILLLLIAICLLATAMWLIAHPHFGPRGVNLVDISILGIIGLVLFNRQIYNTACALGEWVVWACFR
jgi:hypothetical protein